MRALLVDDNAEMRSQLADLLLQAGVEEVVQAIDGLDALSKVSRYRPDLIVTDTQMPNMDGLRMVRALRAAGMPRPIVMLSSVGGTEMSDAARAAGATAFLQKPVDPDRFAEQLRKILALSPALAA